MTSSKKKNKLLYLFIPDHINNPVDLAKRLITSKHKSARFALWLTALSVLASPIDWLLSKFNKNDPTSSRAHGPHIFVCGPARSGTTFTYQVLAQHLDVSYTRNLVALLPRSSRVATRLCTFFYRPSKKPIQQRYENYYGKTNGFSAPSEANYLWNQWVSPDESQFRTLLSEKGADQLAEYFSYLSESTHLPTLAKNNNANVFADKIVEALPNSYFICLKRKTEYLAQSLIRARLEINGDLGQSYGVTNVSNLGHEKDPVDAVMDQIEYLNLTAEAQQQTIGKDRYWIVDYEDFCANPTNLINRIRSEVLLQKTIDQVIPSFPNSNVVVDKDIFARITHTMNNRKA